VLRVRPLAPPLRTGPPAAPASPSPARRPPGPPLFPYTTLFRSITGTTFHTGFSTGHGLGYWRGGEQVGSTEWGNIGVQDRPVTWQWWFDGDGQLQADYDYGPGHVPAERFAYTPVDPYEGGSSLVVEGELDGDAMLRLFLTALEVTE